MCTSVIPGLSRKLPSKRHVSAARSDAKGSTMPSLASPCVRNGSALAAQSGVYSVRPADAATPSATSNPTTTASLRLRKPVDRHLEHVIHADPVDAVGFHAGLGRRLHHGAVDDVVDLVGADADLERVDRLAVGARLLHRIARLLGDHVARHLAFALLDEPRAILRDEEIRVGLRRAVETAPAEYEAVVIRVAAQLEQR